MAALITAIGAATSAVLAGTAALIAALAKRETSRIHAEVRSTNGRTLAATVSRIEADTLEQTTKLEQIDRKVEETGA